MVTPLGAILVDGGREKRRKENNNKNMNYNEKERRWGLFFILYDRTLCAIELGELANIFSGERYNNTNTEH